MNTDKDTAHRLGRFLHELEVFSAQTADKLADLRGLLEPTIELAEGQQPLPGMDTDAGARERELAAARREGALQVYALLSRLGFCADELPGRPDTVRAWIDEHLPEPPAASAGEQA